MSIVCMDEDNTCLYKCLIMMYVIINISQNMKIETEQHLAVSWNGDDFYFLDVLNAVQTSFSPNELLTSFPPF